VTTGLPDSTLHLDVIGAGPAYTDRLGATGAAYLVRHGTTAILLDLGQGSFPRLAGLVDPATLDAILVSHLHPDHFIDLISLRHYLRWTAGPGRRVRVLAPDGLEARLDALHAEPGFTAVALDVDVLEPGRLEIGSLRVEVVAVTHSTGSCAVRVDAGGGSGLVYSGDCGNADELTSLIRPGDTLLTEVTFGPGPVPADVAHLDGPTVGALAGRTRTGQVLLTHLLMGFDRDATVASAMTEYQGPVALVEPGDRFDVGA
jgi:ribonuclease BN (tRNA processing enzyme)